MTHRVLREGMMRGELTRLVQPLFGVDEFCSKIGRDKDICVLSFIAFGSEPANDISDFIEKSYDWVLDADVSHGEVGEGNYMVYVEFPRDKKTIEHIGIVIKDMNDLTTFTYNDWEVIVSGNKDTIKYDATTIGRYVASSAREYDIAQNAKLNALRTASGVDAKPTEVKGEADPLVKTLQRNAGLA